MKHLLITTLAVLSTVSCTNIPHFNRPPPDTGIRYDPNVLTVGIPRMSPRELERQKGLANNGDGRAAFNVYTYYRSAADDQKQAREWILIAGELGYAPAQYNLAQIYLYENDRDKALYWAKKATASGYPHAQSTLDYLESLPP
ncbi:hypothetical protein HNP33_001704 [Comamonas odontotermitis]|uniref:Sel1 repeat family protein n=1 Tax=Comamonas odontotermitis TaxID=379895 RepID=A0ABR6RER8_9BURK|nr:sel1 repeat family protein [Comamonas odontotermitis]MBB6577647.1 hypothetical protein [Comamonas odontotermitis]